MRIDARKRLSIIVSDNFIACASDIIAHIIAGRIPLTDLICRLVGWQIDVIDTGYVKMRLDRLYTPTQWT